MKEIRRYLLLTFALTYLFWGSIGVYTQIKNVSFNSSAIMLVLYVAGVISPAISAIAVKKHSLTEEEFKIFIRNILSPVKKLNWYIVAVLMVLFFKIVQFSIFGGEKVASAYMILLQLPIYILIGGLEEVGWRGLLFANLQNELSVFKSIMLTGIIWTVWHAPLFFIHGTYQEMFSSLYTFALNTLGFTFVLSVIFQNTKSIFMCILSHALLNSISAVLITEETLLSSLITLLAGVVIFFGYRLYENMKSQANARL
jgi:membrane protease YdiL (CAAX protease family)